MPLKPPPDQVIRFYGNTDYALECIALKQITFIHVDRMNDPFDVIPYFSYDFSNNESFLANVKAHLPNEDYEALKNDIKIVSYETLKKDWTEYLKNERKKMFIFSASAVSEKNNMHKNLYMWGHYGNGHRGVAIKFNTKVLTERFKDQIDQFSPYGPWIKAKDMYEYIMKKLSNPGSDEFLTDELQEAISTQIRSKNDVWSKEEEWRLILPDEKTKIKFIRHDLPDKAILSVYLGCRLSDNKKTQSGFIDETKRQFPEAELFKALMKPNEHALSFEQIA